MGTFAAMDLPARVMRLALQRASPTKDHGKAPQAIPMCGPDPIVEGMKRRGIPVTRQNWLGLAFPEEAPDPMPGELLQTSPPELR